jgi:two-component system CheB/CheR fusion protein
MAVHSSSPLFRYGSALASVALATVARELLDPLLLDAHPFFTYVVAVVFVAWYGGLGPSMLTLVLGSVAASYCFLSPRGSLEVHRLPDVIGLGLFLFVGLFSAVLCESLRAARRQAEISTRQALSRQAELAEADRQKDLFLASLAHELRNPLAPIRDALQVIHLMGPDDATHAIISRQLQALVRLVDDLLDVSRISRGKVRMQLEPVDLAAVVDQAVETSRPLINQHRHLLTVSVPRHQLVVEADPTRLAQVLANLLNNAAKYTDDGGRIWLTAEREGDEVVVRVKDTGVGIPAEMLPKVFELFTQVDRSLDRSQGGLGIGLTLVRNLVALHRGTVQAFSDGPGKGSEFVVHLPVRAHVPAAAEDLLRALDRPAGPASGQRVLIVDDHQDSADTLATLLRLWGHDVRVAFDGPQAVETAMAFRPEFVLLDIGLPGAMSGYDVARWLRQEQTLGALRLVALTGHGTDADRRKVQAEGFDAHLTKPADLEAIRQLLACRPESTGDAAEQYQDVDALQPRARE